VDSDYDAIRAQVSDAQQGLDAAVEEEKAAFLSAGTPDPIKP